MAGPLLSAKIKPCQTHLEELSVARCFAGSPCSVGRITGLCRGHLEARNEKARRECIGTVHSTARCYVEWLFCCVSASHPRSRRDPLCSRPETRHGKSAVGVSPPPPPRLQHNYTLPSLPLLPSGCHRNQPARTRPASRVLVAIQSPFQAPQRQPPARDWSCSGR